MKREELQDDMTVIVAWPEDDPETARVFKTRKGFGLRFEAATGEVLSEMPDINDKLLGILQPYRTE